MQLKTHTHLSLWPDDNGTEDGNDDNENGRHSIESSVDCSAATVWDVQAHQRTTSSSS